MNGDESYLLWLLSDSNLPTGGFVASSGLESYVAHGFLHLPPPVVTAVSTSSRPSPTTTWNTQGKEGQMAEATLHFLRESLGSYARTALPFLAGAHSLTARHLDGEEQQSRQRDDLDDLEQCLAELTKLESTYHSLALNHVLRRASRAQGIALLTLYARSFASSPSGPLHSRSDDDSLSVKGGRDDENMAAEERRHRRAQKAARLMEGLKKRVRLASVKGGGPYGHLPTCWAVFTAALGIRLESAISLHLFLQARSIISSSVRLNTLGPYHAHELLLGPVREVLRRVEADVGLLANQSRTQSEGERGSDVGQGRGEVRPVAGGAPSSSLKRDDRHSAAFEWDWEEEGDWYLDEISPHRVSGTSTMTAQEGGKTAAAAGGTSRSLRPAVTTWPLGEIVQGRHDALHSRLFNS